MSSLHKATAAARKKAPLINTTIETPKQAKAGAIVAAPASMGGTAKDIAAQIIRDHNALEFASRHIALFALRIGLRLVLLKSLGGHGSLEPFFKEHFSGEGKPSRRSLFNYIRMADQFVSDCGLRDGKTHKLTDGAAIQPLVDAQPEALAHPGMQPTGIVAKAMQWIGGRGLTQIYTDLSAEEEVTLPAGGGGSGGKKPTKQTPEETAREAFKTGLDTFKTEFSEAKWKHLYERDSLALEKWLGEAYRRVKEHNAARAKEKRKAGKAKPAAAKK